MKFLIDESVEYSIVMYLRQEKHDVIAVCEESSGIRDEDVLRRAVIDQRVLITNEKNVSFCFISQIARSNKPIAAIIAVIADNKNFLVFQAKSLL